MKKTGELGPVYDVPLIDSLPVSGSMTQAMPSRSDLSRTYHHSPRTAAGYEVLLKHYLDLRAKVELMQKANEGLTPS